MTIIRIAFCFLCLATFVASASPAAASLVNAGPDFSSSGDGTEQGGGTIARLAAGRFVTVWSKANDSNLAGAIAARVFESASGNPLGPEIELLSGAYADPAPRVVADASGNNFVVLWKDGPQPGFTGISTRWRAFDQSGLPLTAEIPVGNPAVFATRPVGIVVEPDGEVDVMYHEVYQVLSYIRSSLRLQRYTSAGATIGAPVVIADDQVELEDLASVGLALASDGTIAVSWIHIEIEDPPGFENDRTYPTGRVRRYDGSGVQVGSDFQFAPTFGHGVVDAGICSDGAGHLFVRYTFTDNLVHTTSVATRRFALDGTMALDLPLPDPTYTYSLWQMDATSDGRLALIWISYDWSGYPWLHAFVQRYTAAGALDGASRPLSDALVWNPIPTDVSIDEAGSIIAAFTPRVTDWVDARLRRFCETTDAACAICPAFDDGVDSDGDALPDGCDPCNLVLAEQIGFPARTFLSFGGSTEPSENFFPIKANRVDAAQTFFLPPPVSFADLEPDVDGMRVRVESTSGGAMFDVMLPPGAYAGRGTAGWIRKATKFVFVDRTTDPIAGISKVMVASKASQAPGKVMVRLRAAGDRYGAEEDYLPMKTIVVLGDASASISGICSETAYALQDCSVDEPDGVRCSQR